MTLEAVPWKSSRKSGCRALGPPPDLIVVICWFPNLPPSCLPPSTTHHAPRNPSLWLFMPFVARTFITLYSDKMKPWRTTSTLGAVSIINALYFRTGLDTAALKTSSWTTSIFISRAAYPLPNRVALGRAEILMNVLVPHLCECSCTTWRRSLTYGLRSSKPAWRR